MVFSWATLFSLVSTKSGSLCVELLLLFSGISTRPKHSASLVDFILFEALALFSSRSSAKSSSLFIRWSLLDVTLISVDDGIIVVVIGFGGVIIRLIGMNDDIIPSVRADPSKNKVT